MRKAIGLCLECDPTSSTQLDSGCTHARQQTRDNELSSSGDCTLASARGIESDLARDYGRGHVPKCSQRLYHEIRFLSSNAINNP